MLMVNYVSIKLGRKKKSKVGHLWEERDGGNKMYYFLRKEYKNSLVHYIKKRWHIYCYINVIYIL